MSTREQRPTMEAPPETLTKGSTSTIDRGSAIRPAHDVVSRIKDAYAVLVIGKAARRHVFFGLPAAEKAVARARARGDYAELVLVKLVPAGEPR